AHPYSQKANLALGASETGFLLGYIPGTVTYTDIDNAVTARRLSAALFFLSTNDDPGATVHVPPWHRAIVARIADHVGVPRTVASTTPPPLGGTTRLDIDVRADHAEAFVRVLELGADIVDVLGDAVAGLTSTCDCVY